MLAVGMGGLPAITGLAGATDGRILVGRTRGLETAASVGRGRVWDMGMLMGASRVSATLTCVVGIVGCRAGTSARAWRSPTGGAVSVGTNSIMSVSSLGGISPSRSEVSS